MYECDCCERPIVPQKMKGIGYLCDDCIAAYIDERGEVASHWPVCPFKIRGQS